MSDDEQQQRDREEAAAWAKERSRKLAGAQQTTWIRWAESDSCDGYLAGLRAERARNRVLREAVTCAWTEWEDGQWESSCGLLWEFENDRDLARPSVNGMKFCPRCGHPLAEHPYVDPDLSDDEEENEHRAALVAVLEEGSCRTS